MSLNNVTETLDTVVTQDSPANAVLVSGISLDNNKFNNGPKKRNGKTTKRNGATTKRRALNDDDIKIPTFHEFQKLRDCDYKVSGLKKICRHYNQKVSGNKHELILRLYNHLQLSSKIVKIQVVWKKYLLNVYNNLRGPGRFNRKLCVNETDFFTMDDISATPYEQIYTYKDEIGQIYAFEISSLFNLFKKGSSHTTNPYNRVPFPPNVRNDLKRILRLCKIFGDEIDVSIEEIAAIPIEKQLELRAIGLFHEIDSLGNYTDPTWFNSLDRIMLIRFMRELGDIWHYRAQLSHQAKRDICPPVGNPFGTLNMRALPVFPHEQLKRMALNVVEIMVKHGICESNRTLGANYVLCALTLVCPGAAESLPWLYQSVAPNE